MDVRIVAALLVTLALAGCTATPVEEAPEEELDFEEIGLEASESTGILRGVVVDEAIRPIAGALVELGAQTPRNMTTTEDGLFGFDGLEPGTYFLQVSRLGFKSVQQSAEVIAGEESPAAVKVLLIADASTAPFVEAQVYDGYIECTTSVLVLCGAPAILTGQQLTNDRFAWDQYFSDGASHLQAEMMWESTQPLSPELYFELEALNDGCESSNEDIGSFLNSTSGPSPIYATINQTEVQAWSIGQACPVWVSIFSGGIFGTPVGVTVQQRFTMYFHGFYNFMPNAGWRFSVDGEPTPPA